MYVVIAGGGLVGRGVAQMLVENRHDVVVIEREQSVCENITARIGALAIRGTATDIDILEDAGIRRAEVAVGTMPVDADNLAFSVLARNFGVPRILARMRNPRYEAAYTTAGVTRILNVRDIFVQQLVLEVEQPELHQVATFGEGKAAIVVARIPQGAVVHGKTVQEIAQSKEFPTECIIAGVFRPETDTFVIPRGSARVNSGDQVFLVAETSNIRKAGNYLLKTPWRRPGLRKEPVPTPTPPELPAEEEEPSQPEDDE